jgi:hypothetical protein
MFLLSVVDVSVGEPLCAVVGVEVGDGKLHELQHDIF